MGSNDQEKIKIAREYFIRADQGSPVLELFHEDAEVYFPKFGFGFGRNSFLEMVKGFEGTLESIRHDYDLLTFIPSADYLVVEGTSQGRMSGKSWAGGKTPGGRFCNVTVSGESDDHPSGGFSFNGRGSAGPWHFEPIFDFRIERSCGQSEFRGGAGWARDRRQLPINYQNKLCSDTASRCSR
jgi:hypothetical protein